MSVRRLVAVVVAALALVTGIVVAVSAPGGAAAAPGPGYIPPVPAPIRRPFDPPASPFGPGNRGLDYWTTPGQSVVASADGEVIFAGEVGGTLHVTIRHADGLRTSYSFLDEIDVSVGQRVRQGDQIGTASADFHFGVRDPDGTYLDPAKLFAGALRPTPHLVPGVDEGEAPLTSADERDPLRAVVGDRLAEALAFGDDVAGQITAGLRDDVRSLADLTAPPHLASIAKDLQVWYLAQSRCTSPSAAVPSRSERHILIEVGGIGTSSHDAAITRVDTGALGYAPDDVIQYSYDGGRVPAAAGDHSAMASLASSTYTPTDTENELQGSAARLDQLLAAVAGAQPGVPIDIVAHSQGGVVSRLALEQTQPPLPAEVRTLVTLSTPHHGADLATAVTAAERDPTLAGGLSAADATGALPLDPRGASVPELAETSPLIDQLNRQPLAPGVHLVSVGASGDLVVPAPRTLVDDAGDSTVVDLDGLHAHDDLPGSAAATREIGLAVAGAPPTCRTLAQATRQAVTSETIATLEDTATAAAVWGPPLTTPGRH